MHLSSIFLSISLVSLIDSIICWPDYRLYKNNENYTVLTPQNLLRAGFNHDKETKFLIHGFGDNTDVTRMKVIKEELFKSDIVKKISRNNQEKSRKNQDINLVMVDWRGGSQVINYNKAASNSKIAGRKLGEFIKSGGINPKRVHCIGHSLGAHACGFAGKVVKLRRISGLDPAGPDFRHKSTAEKLYKTDADFVDVIHVDGIYGIQEKIGHKDFYPNGGFSQPGCALKRKHDPLKIDITEHLACSHLRVPALYAESINSKCTFKSVSCTNYVDFLEHKCNCTDGVNCSTMGYYADFSGEDGVFYLRTDSKDPFCLS